MVTSYFKKNCILIALTMNSQISLITFCVYFLKIFMKNRKM